MTKSEQSQDSTTPGTRFAWFSKYEDAPGELQNDHSIGSVKNFPKAFIPMEELEESKSGE